MKDARAVSQPTRTIEKRSKMTTAIKCTKIERVILGLYAREIVSVLKLLGLPPGVYLFLIFLDGGLFEGRVYSKGVRKF